MNEWFERLTRAPRAELEQLFLAGAGPDVETLTGFEFRGANTGALARRVGLQKFIKGFFRGHQHLEGYNIRVQQNALSEPWVPLPNPETPSRFGFFLVTPADPNGDSPDQLPPGVALLDYGASPHNPRWRVERLLRDYVVVPDPDQPDVLLGKAYLALLGVRMPAGFFIIERLRSTTFQP